MRQKASKGGGKRRSSGTALPPKPNVMIDGPFDPDRIRIATLSWELESEGSEWKKEKYGKDVQTVEEFLTTLGEVARTYRKSHQPDLILSAGHPVADTPAKKELMDITEGSAVLFEEASGIGGPWKLGAMMGGKGSIATVRGNQHVRNSFDLKDPNNKHRLDMLLSSFSRGEGMVRLAGLEATLILLICGENNILEHTGQRSVLRGRSSDSANPAFHQPWIALNPVHKPYRGKSRSTGFGKIGRFPGRGRSYPPTMLRLVSRKERFKDSTASPLVFVHSNNISRRHRSRTAEYSSVVFMKGAEERKSPIHQQDAGLWKYTLYEFPRHVLVE